MYAEAYPFLSNPQEAQMQLAKTLRDFSSLQFYGAVANNIPPEIIAIALNAVKEAATSQTLRKTPGAYFAWLLRQWGIVNHDDPYPWRTFRRNTQPQIPGVHSGPN